MMKRILVLIFGIAVAGMAYAQTATTSKPTGPVITWEKSTHDFGDMQQGEGMIDLVAYRNFVSFHFVVHQQHPLQCMRAKCPQSNTQSTEYSSQ